MTEKQAERIAKSLESIEKSLSRLATVAAGTTATAPDNGALVTIPFYLEAILKAVNKR